MTMSRTFRTSLNHLNLMSTRGLRVRNIARQPPPLGWRAMKVLVTGGAGYIGSTTAKALEARRAHAGDPRLAPHRSAGVRGRPPFYEGDIADRELLGRVVAEHPDLDCTIHMAARIVVPSP